MSTHEGKMTALWYNKPRDFEIRQVPIPDIGEGEVLLEVNIPTFTRESFSATFPLIPGHEVVGTVVKLGSEVQGFSEGDRVVADVMQSCHHCVYCKQGKPLFCLNLRAQGCTEPGGFAEYVAFNFSKCHKINNLTDEEATLVEPASCAIHGMDKIKMPFGAKCLLIGAGPTGLMLAQLLKLGGASSVTIAANKGIKMDIARKIEAADHYLDLERDEDAAKKQWDQLLTDNPYGFDVVAECTGVESIVNDAINYVGRGGTLLVYGVYPDAARVTWSPAKIFMNEINIVGSFAQVYCFTRAVELLESKKIRTAGMVTDVSALKDYQMALDKMAYRNALKIAIRP
ncbi:chaperonin 10-like protein [Dioszegia hungarica]|uniref:Chaperonin 10-like protein n=1 Tax=Dioszegia hungarica TaxID=4972 RepID=A0AA38LRL6_9TREE|nr:chaperonin 10-like protein [Dioszegia hungarica]KAI9632638.1 chaperonin 10-like protein [Dioszegia hungarica]